MSLSSNEDYVKIKEFYSLNKVTYQKRIDQINLNEVGKINWSDTFLDFSGYESIFSQLKKIKLYDKEKPSTVKNYFFNDLLIYSVNNDNYRWGSVFVDYQLEHNIWLLFSENINDEIVLRQVKIKNLDREKRVNRLSTYLYNDDFEDEIEETFMIDEYEYDLNGNLIRIIRKGFYQNNTKEIPIRLFSFEYEENKMKIYSTQDKSRRDSCSTSIIYDGKIIKPI